MNETKTWRSTRTIVIRIWECDLLFYFLCLDLEISSDGGKEFSITLVGEKQGKEIVWCIIYIRIVTMDQLWMVWYRKSWKRIVYDLGVTWVLGWSRGYFMKASARHDDENWKHVVIYPLSNIDNKFCYPQWIQKIQILSAALKQDPWFVLL